MVYHLVEQKKERFIKGHLVARVYSLGKVDRHIDVVQLLIELDIQCCTHYLDEH